MAKKSQKPATANTTSIPGVQAFGMPLPDNLKDSAHHNIWLAGLGAFSKAQEQGGKVFESLVNDGLELQRKTQALAEERIHEAASRMSQLGTGLSTRAAGQMDKLENIFEDRVAKALHRLGVPSAQDMAALLTRLDEVNRELLRLNPPAKPPVAATKKTTVKAGPAKPASGERKRKSAAPKD